MLTLTLKSGEVSGVDTVTVGAGLRSHKCFAFSFAFPTTCGKFCSLRLGCRCILVDLYPLGLLARRHVPTSYLRSSHICKYQKKFEIIQAKAQKNKDADRLADRFGELPNNFGKPDRAHRKDWLKFFLDKWHVDDGKSLSTNH
uniref:Uncharacterized protein n=1 Tax=Solanum tuberosum TaxID=4113 RepID=M1DEL2_SOLTU